MAVPVYLNNRYNDNMRGELSPSPPAENMSNSPSGGLRDIAFNLLLFPIVEAGFAIAGRQINRLPAIFSTITKNTGLFKNITGLFKGEQLLSNVVKNTPIVTEIRATEQYKSLKASRIAYKKWGDEYNIAREKLFSTGNVNDFMEATDPLRRLKQLRSAPKDVMSGATLSFTHKLFGGSASFYGANEVLNMTSKSKENQPLPWYNLPGHLANYAKFSLSMAPANFVMKGGLGIKSHSLDFMKRGILGGAVALHGRVSPNLINKINDFAEEVHYVGRDIVTPTWDKLRARRITRTSYEDYSGIVDEGLEKFKLRKTRTREISKSSGYNSHIKAILQSFSDRKGMENPIELISQMANTYDKEHVFSQMVMNKLGFRRSKIQDTQEIKQIYRDMVAGGANLDSERIRQFFAGGGAAALKERIPYDIGQQVSATSGIVTNFRYPFKEKIFQPIRSLEPKLFGRYRIGDFFGLGKFVDPGYKYMNLSPGSKVYVGSGTTGITDANSLDFLKKNVGQDGFINVGKSQSVWYQADKLWTTHNGHVIDLLPPSVKLKIINKSLGVDGHDMSYVMHSGAARQNTTFLGDFVNRLTDNDPLITQATFKSWADLRITGIADSIFGSTGLFRKFFNASSPTRLRDLFNPKTAMGEKYNKMVRIAGLGEQVNVLEGNVADTLNVLSGLFHKGAEIGRYDNREFLEDVYKNLDPVKYSKFAKENIFGSDAKLSESVQEFIHSGLNSSNETDRKMVNKLVHRYRMNNYVDLASGIIDKNEMERVVRGGMGSRGHKLNVEMIEMLTVGESLKAGKTLNTAVDATLADWKRLGKVSSRDISGMRMWQLDKEMFRLDANAVTDAVTGENRTVSPQDFRSFMNLINQRKPDILQAADQTYRFWNNVGNDVNNVLEAGVTESLKQGWNSGEFEDIERMMGSVGNKQYQVLLKEGAFTNYKGERLTRPKMAGYVASLKAEKAAEFIGLGLGHPYAYKPGLNFWGTLLTKRALPILAVMGAANVADDLLFDLNPMYNTTALNEGLGVAAAEVYAHHRINMSHVFDMTGISSAAKWAEGLMPGSVNSPFSQVLRGAAIGLLPRAIMKGAFKGRLSSEMEGYSMIGGALLSMLGTGFGFWDLTKTTAELKNEYSGREEVPERKSRLWEMGSTPWQGSRIQFYKPNWFATMKSQYMSVPDQLGSPIEQFLYKPWLGIDFNPLGYLLSGGPLGSGHYTSRRYYSRPYPISGVPFSETPLIGPALASTFGRLINPPKHLHAEEMKTALGNWGYYTQNFTSRYVDPGLSDIRLAPPKSPYSLTQAFGEMAYNAQEFAGLRGFGVQTLSKWFLGFNQPFESEDVMAASSQITSFRRAYWDKNLGGLVGTCWIKGTKIVTDKGRISIEDIKIGDKVISSDGKLHSVVHTLKKKANALYKIKTNVLDVELTGTGKHHVPIFRPDVCVDSHNRPCRPGSKKRCTRFPVCKTRKIELVNTNLKDIKKGDYVITPIIPLSIIYGNIDLSEYTDKNYSDKWIYTKSSRESIITYELIENNKTITREELRHKGIEDKTAKEMLYTYRNNTISRIPRILTIDEEIAYVLGWWVAEGNNSDDKSICFSMHSNEYKYALKIVDIIKRKFNGEGNIHVKGNTLRLKVSSYQLYLACKLFKDGAKNKEIPYAIKSMQQGALLEFFKGMMLGDGHCNGKIAGYHCGNDNLVRDLLDIGLSLGFKSYIVTNYFVKGKGLMPQGTPKKDRISSYLYWDKPSIAKIYNLLYDKNLPIPKETRHLSFIYDGKLFIRVESVEELKSNDVDVYDFEVKDKHFYIASHILVSNTEWFRRLVPRKRRQVWEHNPLSNRMPSWMPKEFRIGDAYTKIAYGELLLPGLAYESAHDVHHTFPVNASDLGMSLPETIKKLLNVGPSYPTSPDSLKRQNLEISAAATIYSAEHNVSGTFDEVIRQGRKSMLTKIKNLSDDQMNAFIGPAETDISEVNFMLKQKGMEQGLLYYYYNNVPIMTYPVKFSLNRYEKDIAVIEKARTISRKLIKGKRRIGFSGESYSNFDRLKILTNLAPYSNEFKAELGIVRKQVAAGIVNREDLNKVIQKRENIIRKYELYPYRFKDRVFSPDPMVNILSTNNNIKAAAEYNLPERMLGSAWERFCLVNNQLVFTNNGYKKAEDIKVNDKLLNKSGKFVSVKNISKRKKKNVEKVINIELCKTRIYDLKLTEDHELLVCNIQNKHKHWKRKYNNEPLEWKKAKDITTNDFIVFPKNISDQKFDNDVMRLYGYYLAEGSVQFSRGVPSGIHFSFHTKEKNYHEDVKNIVKKIYNKDVTIRNEKHNSTVVSFYNKEITTFFINNFGRGCVNKKIPSWVFTSSKDNIKNLISGYVRGDGHLFNKGYNMCSISRTLIDGMKQLFINIGIYPACYFKKQKIGNDGVVRKDAYVLSICGDDVNKFNPFIEEIKIKRSRSCSSYTFEKDDCILVKVRTCNIVEYIGEVYDFETDGSYLTSCGIVHNSHMNTPIHSKFLQYRTPLESYQRSMLYGRDIKMWSSPNEHFIDAYKKGFMSKTTKFDGAVAGGIGGTVLLGPGIGTAIGAAVGGMYGSFNGNLRDITGTTYIPNSVEMGRKTHMFFDRLQYEKYMNLYESTGLEEYSEMANSTMAGLAANDMSRASWSRMYNAIPYAEKPYIMPFLTEGDESERNEISKFVPNEVANILRQRWQVMDNNSAGDSPITTTRKGIRKPSNNWAGWSPDVDLEDYELETLKHQGLDSHDYGLGWYEQEHKRRRSLAPIEALNTRETNKIIKNETEGISPANVRVMLERLLRDMGGKATVVVYDDAHNFTNRVNLTLN